MDLYLTFTFLPGDDLSSTVKLVLAAGGDRTIRFWDIGTGDCIKLIRSDLPTKG